MPDTTQQILQLRQQGMNDKQIVQQLQQSGVQTQDIFDAMSQADLDAPAQPGGLPPPGMPPPMQPPMQPMPGQPYQQGMMQMPMQSDQHIQDVAEAIINEKWQEIIQQMQKVIQWKESVETSIQKINDDMKALKDNFQQLHTGVLGKVNQSDTQLRDVSAELGALHKVFKDVIPTFTENVNELARIMTKAKGKTAAKSK